MTTKWRHKFNHSCPNRVAGAERRPLVPLNYIKIVRIYAILLAQVIVMVPPQYAWSQELDALEGNIPVSVDLKEELEILEVTEKSIDSFLRSETGLGLGFVDVNGGIPTFESLRRLSDDNWPPTETRLKIFHDPDVLPPGHDIFSSSNRLPPFTEVGFIPIDHDVGLRLADACNEVGIPQEFRRDVHIVISREPRWREQIQNFPENCRFLDIKSGQTFRPEQLFFFGNDDSDASLIGFNDPSKPVLLTWPLGLHGYIILTNRPYPTVFSDSEENDYASFASHHDLVEAPFMAGMRIGRLLVSAFDGHLYDQQLFEPEYEEEYVDEVVDCVCDPELTSEMHFSELRAGNTGECPARREESGARCVGSFEVVDRKLHKNLKKTFTIENFSSTRSDRFDYYPEWTINLEEAHSTDDFQGTYFWCQIDAMFPCTRISLTILSQREPEVVIRSIRCWFAACHKDHRVGSGTGNTVLRLRKTHAFGLPIDMEFQSRLQEVESLSVFVDEVSYPEQLNYIEKLPEFLRDDLATLQTWLSSDISLDQFLNDFKQSEFGFLIFPVGLLRYDPDLSGLAPVWPRGKNHMPLKFAEAGWAPDAGSYLLTRKLNISVNRDSLEIPVVQEYLRYLAHPQYGVCDSGDSRACMSFQDGDDKFTVDTLWYSSSYQFWK